MLYFAGKGGSPRKYLCKLLFLRDSEGRDFRAELSAASLKLDLVLVKRASFVDFRAELSAASLKLEQEGMTDAGAVISALNSARPH